MAAFWTGAVAEAWPAGAGAVSYTHLDVYKRQVQDSASQFVQLTWLFTMQPDLLQAGRRLDVPLALPRAVETWSYEVLETEQLDTPAGPVAAVHVKPRRPARAGRDLVAEFWAAPSLQYLPVRILIRQDAETYVDLVIDQLRCV